MKKQDKEKKKGRALEDHVLLYVSSLLSIATTQELRQTLIETMVHYIVADTENWHEDTFRDNIWNYKFFFDLLEGLDEVDGEELHDILLARMK